jgi:hypothetical protein
MKKLVFAMMVAIVLMGLFPFGGRTLAGQPEAVTGLAQGDDFLVSRATLLRNQAAIAYNDDLDEYLVVWMDTRASAAYPDIYGQIVSSAGVPRGDNLIIGQDASADLNHPDVAYDTNNQRYLVVWEDSTGDDVAGQLLDQDGEPVTAVGVADGTGADPCATPAVAFHPPTDTYFVVYRRGAAGSYDIEGRRVDADGSVVATPYGITSAAGDQTEPDVGVNPATGGDFLVVWQDSRTGLDRIYGCLLYDTTWLLGAEFVIAKDAAEARSDPAVAFDPDGEEWLVVFERDEAGDSQIVGRRVSISGVPNPSIFGICGDPEDQTDPAVAYDTGSDQFLVAWMDERNDTAGDVYGRRVASGNGPTGDVFAINTATGIQGSAAVAASPAASSFLVAFTDMNSTFAEDIAGQRVNTDGTLAGPRFAISAPVHDQMQTAVAYNSTDGEYLVVWQDRRAGNLDIYGQRLDLDGTLLGDNFAICSNSAGQLYPAVAYNLDTNQYMVVWEDRRSDADIYGQRVNADGSLDGAEVPIAGAGATGRHRPQVAFNPISGEYLVVYVYAEENNNVRGRRVPAAANPSTPEIDIATGTTDQNYPDVACRTLEPGGGGYLVVWRDTDSTQSDVKGQRLNASGDLLTAQDICVEASNQYSPRVAYSPEDDRYLVVWPDARDTATQGTNIYARQVGGTGTLYDEFAVSTAAENQSHAEVSYSSGALSYVVAWQDTRNAGTAPDLYGQRVGGEGALIDTTAEANDPLFVFSGSQESPALAWAGAETSGLVVWEDSRNAESSHIYGLRLEATPVEPVTTDHYLYLPTVIHSE